MPAFHEVRLFYGTQELKDGCPVALELQAVDTLSPVKIVAKIFEAAERDKTLHREWRHNGITKEEDQEEWSRIVNEAKEVGWLVGWLVGWFVGWLVGWLVGCLVGWLAGWLAGWLVGRLVGWLVG